MTSITTTQFSRKDRVMHQFYLNPEFLTIGGRHGNVVFFIFIFFLYGIQSIIYELYKMYASFQLEKMVMGDNLEERCGSWHILHPLSQTVGSLYLSTFFIWKKIKILGSFLMVYQPQHNLYNHEVYLFHLTNWWNRYDDAPSLPKSA